MGGIMPDGERDSIMQRLEKVADAAIRGIRFWPPPPKWDGRPIGDVLAKLWRSLPECERDQTIPPAVEILAACNRYDAMKAEQNRIKREANERERR